MSNTYINSNTTLAELINTIDMDPAATPRERAIIERLQGENSLVEEAEQENFRLESRISDLEDREQKLEDELTTLETERDNLKESVSGLEAERDELKGRITELEAELANAKSPA